MNIWSSSANKAYFWYPWNGNVYISGTTYTSFSNTTASTGDVIGIAIDLDNGYMYLSKNGSWMNSGVPTSGATGTGGIPVVTGHTHYPLIDEGATGTSEIATANFGQDSSFAGNKTAQGNQDSNSVGDFFYEPPTDFLALCTSNLTAPAVKPQENFNTVTYTGNGTSQSITGVGFQPDFIWDKARSFAKSHILVDAVRGINKILFSESTSAEYDVTDRTTSFDSDGFSIGSHASVNQNTSTYVAWNWKAGGADVLNELGTIDSQVSANADAGFSIVSYTGDGLDNADSIGHGLSKKPELVITKDRTAYNWYVDYFENGTPTKHLELNGSGASGTWYPWASASTTLLTSISSGGGGWWTNNTNNQISYCFHSVDGYSKVGSYTGNGLVDGPFVYTGFRPVYFLVKNTTTSATSWRIYDNKRVAYNPINKILYPDTNGIESSTSHPVDFLSNGIKVRGTFSEVNTNGNTYIYLAFAEYPFKYTTAR
jgi:hypothetical protein